VGQEWDSDESSTDSSSDEDATNIAINKGLLFPNVGHKCLMDKDGKKKIHDNEDDLTSLFANLTKDQKKKINELIESINEKDDLLECQEDLLIKENKKNC
jgi:transcription initiation factor IIF auxiliary subunit